MWKKGIEEYSLSGNLDFWLFPLLPFQGSSSMCNATVDIEVVQEIYFFVFFQIQVMILKQLLIFLSFILLENDIVVKYVTESCGINCIWIPISAPVYQFLLFYSQELDDLHFVVNLKEQSITPWMLNLLVNFFCSDIDIWLRVVVQIFLSYNVIVRMIPQVTVSKYYNVATFFVYSVCYS